MIDGHATKRGTARYARRPDRGAAPGHFRPWRELTLSSLGIGTYLGPDDELTDRAYAAAVAGAIERGVNVIDSAVNYRHQRSERSIGAALSALVASGRVARDEVVVATKGGFIPFDGGVPANPAQYLIETYVRPGILRAEDVVANCHCMTPAYLADQIERSRSNLGVAAVDVYYVHNPEIQLTAVSRPVFLDRLRQAFGALEQAVQEGHIRCYGTATWTGLRQPPTARDYLSLAEVVQAATDVGGADHHCRTVQLPYNLGMTEAFTLANQQVGGDTVSVLEAARRLDVFVTTSASIHQGQLARNLPAVVGQFLPGLETDAQRALQFVRSTPGVGTALVGMRTLAHVEENARLAGTPPVPWEEFRKMFQEG